MKRLSLTFFGLILLSSLAGAPAAQATALPDCDQAGILSKVNRSLAIAERNVVRSQDPVITIKRPYQRKVRASGPRAVAQRYCRATGYTSSGRKKSIYYLIEANSGFAGCGYAVEACIMGRDPWKIHGAYCRSVR